MRVPVSVDHTTLQNDSGHDIDGLVVTCSRCGDFIEVFGTSEASASAGAVLLRESCGRGEKNLYVAEYGEDGRGGIQRVVFSGRKHTKTGKRPKKMQKYFDPLEGG